MMDDICYGRVSPVRLKNYRYERGGNVPVTVSFWLAEFLPPYADIETYLRFYMDGAEHRVYNPLKIRFDVLRLVSTLRTFYAAAGAELTGFAIISAAGSKEIDLPTSRYDFYS